MSAIEVKNLSRSYGDIDAVKDVSFAVPEKSFTVLLGPSGCGKSTILKMLSGLEKVSQGTINIGGSDVTEIEASKRGVSMVFQSYALFPHLNVKENIQFGLKVRKVPVEEREKKVAEAAKVVGLTELLDRKPANLSGGQRQRVALARSIVSDQSVCLMDEPLSNLDSKLRAEMRDEIRDLQKRLGLTVVYVTHDQVEAMTLADKIVVLKDGLIQQVGTPLSLYDDPENVFVAGFIGSPTINFVRGDINGSKLSIPSLKSIKLEIDKSVASSYSEILIGLRPQHLTLAESGDLEVEFTEALGDISYIYLKTPNGERIVVESREEKLPSTGTLVDVEAKASKALFFDPKTELRIK